VSARTAPFAISSPSVGHRIGRPCDPARTHRRGRSLSDTSPDIGHGATRLWPRNGFEPGDFWVREVTEPSEHIAGYALPEIVRPRFILSETDCRLWAGELVIAQV
jgi:hypothetical protein